MDDDKLYDIEKELMKRDIDNGEYVICMGVIFVIMILIMGYGLLSYKETVPVNMTGHVVDKQIVWVDGFMDHTNHYFVFTEDYCFDVDLHTYNQLDKSDRVNLTEYYGSVTLNIGNHSFRSDS